MDSGWDYTFLEETVYHDSCVLMTGEYDPVTKTDSQCYSEEPFHKREYFLIEDWHDVYEDIEREMEEEIEELLPWETNGFDFECVHSFYYGVYDNHNELVSYNTWVEGFYSNEEFVEIMVKEYESELDVEDRWIYLYADSKCLSLGTDSFKKGF